MELSIGILYLSLFILLEIVSANQDPFLLVTIVNYNLHDIGIIDLETDLPRNLSLEGLVEPVGVDYDPVDDKIYFSDRITKIIGRVDRNGTNQETLYSFGDDTRLEGLVLNPWSRILFWVDSNQGAIFASDLELNVRKRLIEGDLVRPRGIVADLETSYLYWSEWFDENLMNTAKIERATMSGGAREIIVSDNIVWPNGVTIDKPAERLYWCDAYLDRIESVHLNGTNRTIVLEESPYLRHAFSIALYGGSIYWTEARQNAVVKTTVNENANRTYSLLQFGGNFGVNGLAVASYSLGTNACSRNNGGCFASQLCLPKPSDRICVCLETRDTDETCFYRSQEPVDSQDTPDSTEPVDSQDTPDSTGSDIVIEGCPGDTTITLETDKDTITVTWVEPVARDANGTELEAEQSHTPGDYFSTGTTTVIYAYQYESELSVCTFDVIVVTSQATNTTVLTGPYEPYIVWIAGGAVILIFVALFVCLSIWCLCSHRQSNASRRDGNLIAMEPTGATTVVDPQRRGSMNTLTSHTSLTVNGSFRKQKKRNRKKKKNNPTELIVHIPGAHNYEEMNGNRYVDGATNHENSGRFNTMR